MDNETLKKLNYFIVKAKAATYVGGGARGAACRPGSHDLEFADGDWSYLDSYFGGRDFIGEEVVYFQENTRMGHELLWPHPARRPDHARPGRGSDQGQPVRTVHRRPFPGRFRIPAQ